MCCWFFFFLCPAAFVCFARFGRASRFLAFFLGVPFWAPRVFVILLELMGLELARPFRGPFLWTRGGKGFSCFSCLVFLFPFLFCGHTLSRKARPVISRRPAAGDRARPLARVRARGWPYLGRRVGPLLLWVFDGLFCEPVGHRDPRTPRVQGRFSGKGAFFSAPSQALFHTARFVPAPGEYFFTFLANGGTNSKSCYEYSPELSEGCRELSVSPRAAARIPRIFDENPRRKSPKPDLCLVFLMC